MISEILGSVINAAFIIFGVITNGLVIVCFWRSSYLRDKVTYFLILVLSCTDLFTVATIHPLYVVYWSTELSGNSSKFFWNVFPKLIRIVATMPTCVLIIMNVDRYLATVHPYFYERTVTKRRLLIVVLVTYCVYSTCFVTLDHFDSASAQKFVLAGIVLLLTSTVFIYVKIFSVARKPHPARNNPSHFFASLKLSKAYVLVVICLFTFYLPYAVFLVLKHQKFIQGETVVKYVARWSANVIILNSTINSFIFFWKNRYLREEGKRVLKIELCTR